MPIYTYTEALVLVEGTNTPATGATGVLRPSMNGESVSVWDLNDSPLAAIPVGPLGVHQAFKADISSGVLDFGSVVLVAISKEAMEAGLTAIETANLAAEAAESSRLSAEDAQASANTAAAAAQVSAEAATAAVTVVPNVQTGTTYTLAASDVGRAVDMESSIACTVTVPANVFTAGHIVEVCWIGSGQPTIVAGTGMTLRSPDGNKIAKRYGAASLRFRSTTEAVIAGYTTP